MRLLVTGVGGQLGGDVMSHAVRAGETAVGLTREQCDITDAAAVTAALERHRPDVVVNCAGWTDVDGAEDHPSAAHAANATGPAVLATACDERGTLLVHVSTDYVFPGTADSPIAVDATPRPLSVYGASKLAGEEAVRSHARRHVIVRTSWLFGRDGPNFVLTMLRLLRERDEVRVVADQRGAPTWTNHLAPALLRLAHDATPGTYHVTNSGETTWHGFAARIAALVHARANVVPITTDEFGARARRPQYSVLDNSTWLALGEPPLPMWDDALRGYLAERGVTAARR